VYIRRFYTRYLAWFHQDTFDELAAAAMIRETCGVPQITQPVEFWKEGAWTKTQVKERISDTKFVLEHSEGRAVYRHLIRTLGPTLAPTPDREAHAVNNDLT
jgi:hypothetical protein